MELVGMVLIVAATGVLILWPLLRRTDSASAEIAIAPADRGREKEMALAAIRELEFDYATGKISPEDYAVLRARYEAKALEAITRTEATPPPGAGGGGQGPLPVLRREPAAGGPFLPLLRRAGGRGGGDTMNRAAVAAAVTVAL